MYTIILLFSDKIQQFRFQFFSFDKRLSAKSWKIKKIPSQFYIKFSSGKKQQMFIPYTAVC